MLFRSAFVSFFLSGGGEVLLGSAVLPANFCLICSKVFMELHLEGRLVVIYAAVYILDDCSTRYHFQIGIAKDLTSSK